MRMPTFFALFRPFAFGLAVAYCLTGFVDLPEPIRLGGHTATAQGVVGGDEALLVTQRNILRIGSPFSAPIYGQEERFEGLVPEQDYRGWSVDPDRESGEYRGWVAPE